MQGRMKGDVRLRRSYDWPGDHPPRPKGQNDNKASMALFLVRGLGGRRPSVRCWAFHAKSKFLSFHRKSGTTNRGQVNVEA